MYERHNAYMVSDDGMMITACARVCWFSLTCVRTVHHCIGSTLLGLHFEYTQTLFRCINNIRARELNFFRDYHRARVRGEKKTFEYDPFTLHDNTYSRLYIIGIYICVINIHMYYIIHDLYARTTAVSRPDDTVRVARIIVLSIFWVNIWRPAVGSLRLIMATVI